MLACGMGSRSPTASAVAGPSTSSGTGSASATPPQGGSDSDVLAVQPWRMTDSSVTVRREQEMLRQPGTCLCRARHTGLPQQDSKDDSDGRVVSVSRTAKSAAKRTPRPFCKRRCGESNRGIPIPNLDILSCPEQILNSNVNVPCNLPK